MKIERNQIPRECEYCLKKPITYVIITRFYGGKFDRWVCKEHIDRAEKDGLIALWN